MVFLKKGVRVCAYIFLFFLAGCHFFSGFKPNTRCKYVQYSTQVERAFTKKAKEDFGLRCVSTGGIAYGDIEQIHVGFVLFEAVSLEKARELEVKATELFAQIINGHEKIRPYLREYPFPSTHADVAIAFEDKTGRHFQESEVDFIFPAKGKILYQKWSNEENTFISVKMEPYAEALKLVNLQ